MPWKSRLQSVFEPAVEYLFPALCAHCKEQKRADAFLCEHCLAELRQFPSPIQVEDTVWALYRLNPVVRSLVHLLKYQAALGVAPYLVNLSASPDIAWSEHMAWIPVPLHPARMRERGYNQAEKIALAARQRWGGRLMGGVLRRSRYAGSQTRLEAEARRWNAAGSFIARPPAPESVIIVDDVYTTGATTQACEDALLRVGVKRFMVLALAYEPKVSGRDDWLLDRARGE